MKRRGHHPLFLIDLAVPRDFEPSINLLDDVYLYDIDDLQSIAHAHLRERQTEIGAQRRNPEAPRRAVLGLGRAPGARRGRNGAGHGMTPIVIGTRGSPLAQAQTRLVRQALRQAWPSRTFEVSIVKTEGDRLSEQPVREESEAGKGLFTAELEAGAFRQKNRRRGPQPEGPADRGDPTV